MREELHALINTIESEHILSFLIRFTKSLIHKLGKC